jgi:hypothetical protein
VQKPHSKIEGEERCKFTAGEETTKLLYEIGSEKSQSLLLAAPAHREVQQRNRILETLCFAF